MKILKYNCSNRGNTLNVLLTMNILAFLFISQICIAQEKPVEPIKLLNNLKDNSFLIPQEDHGKVFVDLSKSIFLYYSDSNDVDPDIDTVNFTYGVQKGSFLNKGLSEYLLIIWLADAESCRFYGHYQNYGPTTFLIVFDSNLQQISDIGFQDQPTRLTDVVDIDKDGIDEVFLTSRHSQMGCYDETLMIFSRDFNLPLLWVTTGRGCLEVDQEETIILRSSFAVWNHHLLIRTTLEPYIIVGFDDHNEPIHKHLTPEYKVDEYKFVNGIFEHILSPSNVDWDDDRLQY